MLWLIIFYNRYNDINKYITANPIQTKRFAVNSYYYRGNSEVENGQKWFRNIYENTCHYSD